MVITSSAPTRIDLAGSTLDIWPLYLFHEQAKTINIAINQRAKTKIEQTSGAAIEIRSHDLDINLRLASIDYIEDVPENHPLELIVRLIGFFRPQGGFKITTNCMSPAGAGLGGSSALAVSLAGALNALTGSRYSREELIKIVRNTETQVLKVPAGVQDYYPAVYGGLNSVMLEVTGDTLQRYSHLLAHELESHIVLAYSGQSRNSGMNNWDVTKKFIDKDDSIQQNFGEISKATVELDHALKTSNYAGVAKAIETEMESRRKLSPNIVTEEMQQIIDYSRENGAAAAKVCGAGGGGCMMFFTKNVSDKKNLIGALRRNNTQVIDYHVDSQGLSVHTH